MTKPNLNLLNEMALNIVAYDESYNAILYKAYETAEFAKGSGGDTSTETIRQWCNNLNQSHGLEHETIEEIVLEIEARLG